jgi:HAD superfamily hydrolase (TIGR01509 family)
MFTVLWDNDGVLVDTEGLYFRATQTVLAKAGVQLTADQFKEISLRRGESTFQLAAEAGIGGEQIDFLRAERDRIYAESLGSQSWAIDGVEEVLRTLYGKLRMGVVTGTCREHFEIAHFQTGFGQYLDFVITREDCQQLKPHPGLYLTALKRHHLRPDECIVVEDSERGLASAVAAGLECLIVLSEWTKDGNFRNAVKVLANIRYVPEEVLRWVSRR